MPFEYEALVGQLYVVGGRSISTAPPGALVEVAPLNAARGREADTFFSLVLPSGDALAPSAFYERMAQTAAENYFESTGSVTAGIRETIDYLNRNLLEFNKSHPDKTYEANLLCAVLRSDDLILARVGSGVVVYYHQGKCETLPPDLANDEALFGPPLGVQASPEVKLSRHRVATGTRMILADANLADFTGVQLSEAVSTDDISLAIVAFKELARLQLSLLAVEFVPPEGSIPASVPVREGASTFEIAEAQRQEAAKAKSRQTDTVPAARRGPFGKTGEQLVERSQLGLARGASAAAQGLSLSNRTIEHYFGTPEGKRRFPIPLATGLVILLPVLVVSVVVALWISSSGASAFEQCFNNMLTYADSARGADQSSLNNRIQLWNVTYTKAVECQTLRDDDANVQSIMDEAQRNIDGINDIERRQATLLQPTIPGASLDRIILSGLDVYLLDKTNGIVYRAILDNEDGLTFSLRPTPIENMSRGAVVEGFPVQDLVDIAYSEQEGEINLLTSNGVLIQCEGSLPQNCEAQQLRNFERWTNPTRITFFSERSNFYVLDPGSNQIWRYDQSGGQYVNPGIQYFDGVNIQNANVTNAVDFSIDSNGQVYILLSDGNIQKFESGEIQPFEYGDIPPNQTLNSAQAMYINDAPVGSGIYLADAQTRTIFEFGLGGTRRATYQITEEQLFNALSGVTVSSSLEIIYAISGNAVFAIQQRDPDQ